MNGVVNIRSDENAKLYQKLRERLDQHYTEASEDLRMTRHYCRFVPSLKGGVCSLVPSVPQGDKENDCHITYSYGEDADDPTLEFVVGRSKDEKKPCVDVYYRDIVDLTDFLEEELGLETKFDVPEELSYVLPVKK